MTRAAAGALARMSLSALVLAATSGCGHEARYRLHDISGFVPRLAFTLDDASSGAPVTARSFRGKTVLLYFGYTHCPDVCPATLAKLASAVTALAPDERDAVRILFVTVDPMRDTNAVLKAYAAAFGPQVVALRGTKAEIDTLAARYRVSYGFGKPGANGDYEVSHSSAVFIFDRNGRAVLLADPADGAAAIQSDLRSLVGGPPRIWR